MQNGDLKETNYHSSFDEYATVFALVVVMTQVTGKTKFEVFRMVEKVRLRRMVIIAESPALDRQPTTTCSSLNQ